MEDLRQNKGERESIYGTLNWFLKIIKAKKNKKESTNKRKLTGHFTLKLCFPKVIIH